jgi:Cu(I)/Ag(I) efflux system membrane fusion protein
MSIKWIAAAVVLLAVGAGGGYWWAHHTMRATESSAAPPPGKRKILYWHDPMVPNTKFDKPGKSPFMDMQLVPVYADEVDRGGDVRVSPTVVQNLGIRVGHVERRVINSEVRAVGSVAFDERLLEVVQARVEGYVTQLRVKTPLARVRRGEPLAEILAPQWLEAEQEYLALLDASAERARTLRDAARQRLVVLGVPEATIRKVETTRQANASTTVFAPIDGVVTELGARQGAAFMPGATLFRINGLSSVWVNAQVPEAHVAVVPVGARVEAQATAWPGIPFKGQVIALLPEVDAQTRTVTARVSLENKDRKLSPGMYVTLDLTNPASEPQLVVPSEAVIATGERNVVIVAREGGGFDVVEVTLGAEQGGYSVVSSGLTEGQQIVLSGQFLIDSEASLRSTVNRLEGAQ